MRLLLDTHSLLWFLDGDKRLSERARIMIEDGQNDVLASIAGLWEAAIKHSLGKLDLGLPFEELIPDQLEANSIAVLGVEVPHIVRLIKLPLHHRDPFDRIMIAQSLVEDLPVIGMDTAFDLYGVKRLW
jgi:PIN domain nuclease of toxin-antitoxin system